MTLSFDHDVDAAIAKPPPFPRHPLDGITQFNVISAARFVTQRLSVHIQCRTRMTLANLMNVHQIRHCFPLGSGRHHFFAFTCLSIALSIARQGTQGMPESGASVPPATSLACRSRLQAPAASSHQVAPLSVILKNNLPRSASRHTGFCICKRSLGLSHDADKHRLSVRQIPVPQYQNDLFVGKSLLHSSVLWSGGKWKFAALANL